MSKCDPEATANNKPIVPCGLIAWSLFNDTYGFSVNAKALEVSKKNIAWQSDKKSKFGSDVYPKNFQSSGLIGGAKLNESIPVLFTSNCYLKYLLFSVLTRTSPSDISHYICML